MIAEGRGGGECDEEKHFQLFTKFSRNWVGEGASDRKRVFHEQFYGMAILHNELREAVVKSEGWDILESGNIAKSS